MKLPSNEVQAKEGGAARGGLRASSFSCICMEPDEGRTGYSAPLCIYFTDP